MAVLKKAIEGLGTRFEKTGSGLRIRDIGGVYLLSLIAEVNEFAVALKFLAGGVVAAANV